MFFHFANMVPKNFPAIPKGMETQTVIKWHVCAQAVIALVHICFLLFLAKLHSLHREKKGFLRLHRSVPLLDYSFESFLSGLLRFGASSPEFVLPLVRIKPEVKSIIFEMS